MPQAEEDVCRLCLSKERKMLSIFQNRISKDEISFRTKIMSCAAVEIFADDELPSKICYLCLYQVEKFFQFQTMCENSDLVLRSQIKEAKAPLRGDHEEKRISLDQEILRQDGEKYTLMQDFYSPNCQEKNYDVFTCNICSSVFLSSTLLVGHLMKDHPDLSVFFCKNCNISFSNINLFKNHLSELHCLICSQCDCVFKHESNLKNHLKIHIGEYLSCKFCFKIFHDFYEMKRHELIHSEKTCGFCGKELNCESDYNSHFEVCDQRHYCKFCEQAFTLKKDLIHHVNDVHDPSAVAQGNVCQQAVVVQGNEYQQAVVAQGNDYQQAAVVQGNDYQQAAVAQGNVCQQAVVVQGNEYQQAVVTQGNEYQQAVVTQGNEYQQAVVTQGNEYQQAVVAQGNEYQQAVVAQGNEYQQAVVTQGNECQQVTVLNETQESKSETEQQFKCKNCQKQFSDELSLVSHMAKEHNNSVLKCRLCSKKFGLKTSLKRHERSHLGLKPYQCNFCPRTFKDSSACVVHTRTHTGEHPFRCQECFKDFKQLANLKMHTYRHHKKNKKTAEVKPAILDGGGNDDYEHLYPGDVMQNYSTDNMSGYQGLNENIAGSFHSGINMFMSDHQST